MASNYEIVQKDVCNRGQDGEDIWICASHPSEKCSAASHIDCEKMTCFITFTARLDIQGSLTVLKVNYFQKNYRHIFLNHIF